MDYPAGQDGLAEWLAAKARDGYELDVPITTVDPDGRVVLRYPARRVTHTGDGDSSVARD